MIKALILLLVCLPSLAQTSYLTLDDLIKKKGFLKLLPQGKIPAIFKPEFVAAAEADMPADTWVIGVSYQGFHKAYAINLLNHHEIVNDFIGDKPIATTW